MLMFKTRRRRTFNIGSANWLKRNTKTVLTAFFKKVKKIKDMVKLNILLCLDTIAIKILSPKIWINEIFS